MIPSNKTLEDFLTDNKRYRKSQFTLLPSIGDNETSIVSLPNLDGDANLVDATEDDHDTRRFRNKGKGRKSKRESAPERKTSRKSRRTRDRSSDHFLHKRGDYEKGGHVSRPRQVVQVITMSAPKSHEDDQKQYDVQARALADIENAKMKKMMRDLKRDQKAEHSPVIPARLAQKAPITNSPYVASRSRNNSESRNKPPQDIAEAVNLFKEIRGEIVTSSDINKATVDRRALPDYQYHFKNLVNEKSKRALSLQAPIRQPERARARNLSCDYNSQRAKPRYLPPLDDMKDEYEKYSRSAPIVKAKKAETEDTKVVTASGEKRLKKKKPLIVRHTKKSSQMQANMKDKKHEQREDKYKTVPVRSKNVSVITKQLPQRVHLMQKDAPKAARRSPVSRQQNETSLESVISVTPLKGKAKDSTTMSCKKQVSSHVVTRSHGNTALSAKKSSSEKQATSESPCKDAVTLAKMEKKAGSPVPSIKISCPRVSRASTASAGSFYSDKGSINSARSTKASSSPKSAQKSVDRISSARSATKCANKPTPAETVTPPASPARSAASSASKSSTARSSLLSTERSSPARSAKASPQTSARSATPESVRSGKDAAQNNSRSSSARPTSASPERALSSTSVHAAERSAKSASQSPERAPGSEGTTPRSRPASKASIISGQALKSASLTSRSAKSDRSACAVSPTRSERTRNKSLRASARSQPASLSTSYAKIDGYSPIPSARSTTSSTNSQSSARESARPASGSTRGSLQSAHSSTARPKSVASVKSNKNKEKPHSAMSRVSSRTQPKESPKSSAKNDTERALPSRKGEISARDSRSSSGSVSARSGKTSKCSFPSARREKESMDSSARASSRSSVKEVRSDSSKNHTSASMPSSRSRAPSVCSNVSTESAKYSANINERSNDEKYAAGSKSSSSHTLRSSATSRNTEVSTTRSRRSDVKSSKSTTRSVVSVASSAAPSPRSSVKSSRTATPSARSVKSSRNSIHCDTAVRSQASSVVSGETINPRGSSSKGSCRLTRSQL